MDNPDEVVERAAARGVKLSIKQLDEEYILIEGSEEALLFLSKLLASVASQDDCGFQIGPRGAGSALFSHDSTLGVYIHGLPCDDKR